VKTIDLKRTPSFKVKQTITTHCGGERPITRFSDRFKKGMGGFIFRDAGAQNQPYRAILAIYQNGIGIYCRNIYSNYQVLIPTPDIHTIEIRKNTDIIQPKRFSLYALLRKSGLKHHQVSGYLMPSEWKQYEQAICTIHTPETFFSLELDKCTPESLITYFQNSPVADRMIPTLHPPNFV